jgi:hypothetical protein
MTGLEDAVEGHEVDTGALARRVEDHHIDPGLGDRRMLAQEVFRGEVGASKQDWGFGLGAPQFDRGVNRVAARDDRDGILPIPFGPLGQCRHPPSTLR